MSVEMPGESMAVQLTRMEGKFDLLTQRVGDLAPRVTRAEEDIRELQSTTQRLASDALAAANTRIATADAVKEADAARVAAAKAEVEKSTQKWTPWERIGGVMVAIATIAGVIIAFYLAMRPA